MQSKLYNVFICIGLLLGISGTSIYAYTETSVENHFTTGIIDIELEEYTIENGQEVLWKDDIKNVLPGQDICKIPRIYNDGNDCYVRANINFVDTSLSEDVLYGMSDNWVLAKDGYYYYTDLLPSGENVDIFKGFKVPDDFEQEMEGTRFQLEIDVDAVQSDNFIPNYTLERPWGEVEILSCKKEGLYDLTTFKKPDYLNFRVTYEGESGKLIKNEDDFFKNFPVMLPGDVYSDTLEYVNNSDKKVNLYFRTKALDGTELLDKITLKIINHFNEKDVVVYEGNIRAADLNENILLATLEKEEYGKLIYEIEVPKELDNAYTLMEDEVIWIFSTEPIEEIDAVPTGDKTMICCLTILGIGFLFIIIGISLSTYERVRTRHGR